MFPAWISIYNQYKAQVEITYHFPNINGAAVEVQNGLVISPHTLCWACDYLSMLGLKLIHVNKATTAERPFPKLYK